MPEPLGHHFGDLDAAGAVPEPADGPPTVSVKRDLP
jgi:hypothetical protein